VLDPTIQHLITVARRTKAVNPNAEFTVLGALTKDENSEKKGFMRNPEATFGAVVMKQSENVNEIMAFLNWVYESEENYNLCRFGIEGTHWVNNGDGTYSYPANSGYSVTAPAYSGILTLVENQRMSNLVYDGYSAEEKRWISDIAGNADNYVKNDVMDYLFTSSDADNLAMAKEMTGVYQKLALPAWQGIADPTAAHPQDASKSFFQYTIDTYNKGVNSIQKKFTAQYNNMKAARGN
jgi:putative aldouronate transport system substrate-binding protein